MAYQPDGKTVELFNALAARPDLLRALVNTQVAKEGSEYFDFLGMAMDLWDETWAFMRLINEKVSEDFDLHQIRLPDDVTCRFDRNHVRFAFEYLLVGEKLYVEVVADESTRQIVVRFKAKYIFNNTKFTGTPIASWLNDQHEEIATKICELTRTRQQNSGKTFLLPD